MDKKSGPPVEDLYSTLEHSAQGRVSKKLRVVTGDKGDMRVCSYRANVT